MTEQHHQTSGNWKLGLGLALTTMLLWSTLPVALKLALDTLDAWTLTWFRFVIAAVIGLGWLALRDGFSQFRQLRKQVYTWLAISALALIGNYVLYVLSLNLTTPANAQVIIQLAPLMMAMGGLLFFKERYQPFQWLGFAVLVTGLGLFFADQIKVMSAQMDAYIWGTVLMVLASISWAIYALVQKLLLKHLTSQGVLIFIYVFAAIALLPTSQPADVIAMDGWQWFIVVYCALNTLGAYGAFAEALNHWEVSRVSAVLALTPLGALFSVWLLQAFQPGLIAPEQLDFAGWLGAILVVGGSILTSVAGNNNSR